MLALLVLNLSFEAVAFAQVQDERQAQLERDAQIYVNKLGVGKKPFVVVKLKDDKQSLKGYISEINDENFVVTDKNNVTTRVQFSSVRKVSKDRSRTYLAIGVAVGVVLGLGLICGATGCGER